MDGAPARVSDASTWCRHFNAGRCRSCTLLPEAYADQLAHKVARTQAAVTAEAWLPPVTSPVTGFRNKAKMVVAGTLDAPTLGILSAEGTGVDLRDCGLHEQPIVDALPVLADFIQLARLEPYAVRERRGELKHLVVTSSPDGELMVRFVMRSTEALARLRKHLPALTASLPSLRVASLNVQPRHAALPEGPDEHLLTEQGSLPMRVNDVTLQLQPQSFFQTNTGVAAQLYRLAREWTDSLDPASVLDLYCGVGGFAHHLAAPGREVVGVEVSEEAVRAASSPGDSGPSFLAGDATAYAVGLRAAPDLVVVNPPRRGLDPALAGWLDAHAEHVLYSSCNVDTLARDLAAMPSLRVHEAVVLDMFPNTAHHEVLVRLSRG